LGGEVSLSEEPYPELPPVPDDFSVPDAIEPFVGWRLWRIDVDNRLKWRLKSLYRDTLWDPGERATATCPREPHEPAAWKCICGIYAYKAPYRTRFKNDAFYRPRELALVVGQVKLWGNVVTAEYGYRGQYAYPSRLYVLTLTGAIQNPVVGEVADELARAYGVPASIAARWEYL
jgi:hypothetical protein